MRLVYPSNHICDFCPLTSCLVVLEPLTHTHYIRELTLILKFGKRKVFDMEAFSQF